MVILATVGPTLLGVYSLASIICQGIFYVPNVLSMVMYPRFQERYGATASALSLQRFVELPLHVLADTLLAATAVLLVALPPAIAAFFPDYVDAIPPLRILLVGTYFLCLTPPAGQLLLTVRKQVRALFIGIPAMALALAAAYAGSRYGIEGVAAGVSIAFFVEFVAVNAYAFSHFTSALPIVMRLAGITATAALVVLATVAINRLVPPGPAPMAVVGGARTLAALVLSLPLLLRAVRRIRAIQTLG